MCCSSPVVEISGVDPFILAVFSGRNLGNSFHHTFFEPATCAEKVTSLCVDCMALLCYTFYQIIKKYSSHIFTSVYRQSSCYTRETLPFL